MLLYMHLGMVQYRKNKIFRGIDKPLRGIPKVNEHFGDDITVKLTADTKNHRALSSDPPRGGKGGEEAVSPP